MSRPLFPRRRLAPLLEEVNEEEQEELAAVAGYPQFPPREGVTTTPETGEAVSMYERPMDFTDPPGEFEIEQEGGDPEQVPWGPENPLWQAFKRGQCKIVRGPDGQDYLWPREAYAARTKDDSIPLECYANASAQAVRDQPASLAQIRFQYGKMLCAFAAADVPANLNILNPQLSPLLVPPTQPGGANTPNIGGVVLVASLDFGFEGGASKYMFDLPPGQTIKAPFAGNFGRLNAKLWPKYWHFTDGGGFRTYQTFAGGPNLTSELWNAESGVVISAQAVIDNANPAPCRGWISLAEGLSNDTAGKPVRRFFGSVLTTGAVAGQMTTCPVAFGAMWVMLVGGLFAPVGAQQNVLAFRQNGPGSPSAITTGPFPSGVMVPLIDNVQSIDVFETTTGAAPKDVPFELLYFMAW
jgi:hypothetical protein